MLHALVAGSLVSALAVPIVSGDDVAAVLYVESDRPGAFDRAQVITLETLADGDRDPAAHGRPVRDRSRTPTPASWSWTAPRASWSTSWPTTSGPRSPPSWGGRRCSRASPDADRSRTRRERARAIVDERHPHGRSDGPDARDDAAGDRTVRLRVRAGRLWPPLCGARSAASRRIRTTRSSLDLPDEPLPCWADGERIAEVVENLLSNAVKYSPDGGEVRLAVRRERETAVVSVTDQGIGIAPEKQAAALSAVLPGPRPQGHRDRGLWPRALDLRAHRSSPRRETSRWRAPPGEGSTFTLHPAPLRRRRAVARAGRSSWPLPTRGRAGRSAAWRRSLRLHGARGSRRRRGGRGGDAPPAGGGRARPDPAPAAGRGGGGAARGRRGDPGGRRSSRWPRPATWAPAASRFRACLARPLDRRDAGDAPSRVSGAPVG